ncbi:hypothetical protein [Serratia liquefaciens]|uniref:hypothetical protein n=1 Tax=Serratia liquefaciens TaxID=614 RepID=UPI0021572664|nr:hypothetical protein [Serratia liquefaciens]
MVIFERSLLIRLFSRGIIASSVLLMMGCSNLTESKPLFEQSESLTRKQVLLQLQCQKTDNSTSVELTPPELYQRMTECVDEQNYRSATLLFALAGSYSWYDAAKVNTAFAKNQHTRLLADNFAKLNSKQRDALWAHIQSTLGDPRQLSAVCDNLRLVGRPHYDAVYMKQKGDAYSGREGAQQQRWDMALDSYLHCSAT